MTSQRLQRILIDACCAEHPLATLQDLSVLHSAELDAGEHEFLRTVDGEGLALTALLAQRHRLERIIGGDPELLEDYRTDPVGFTQEFLEYAETVTPTHWQPCEEARAYRDFIELFG